MKIKKKPSTSDSIDENGVGSTSRDHFSPNDANPISINQIEFESKTASEDKENTDEGEKVAEKVEGDDTSIPDPHDHTGEEVVISYSGPESLVREWESAINKYYLHNREN